MNTQRLIDILSVDPEPVDSGQLGKALLLAIVAGGAAAFALMLATVGPRPDLQSTAHLEWLAVKLLFTLSVIATGVPLLNRAIRPGLEDRTNWLLISLPFLGAIAVALAMLLLGQPQATGAMLRGATKVSSVRCLLCIVFFAAIPLVALIGTLRSKGAPTRLKLCGGIAGIVAGGIGAAAYAFNCASDTIPFIAIWYGAAIVLCAIIGAQLGPRVLRW
jgi:hypothetical protein